MNGRRLSPLARGVLIGVCFIAFFILLENLLGMASTVKKETVVKKEQQQQQQEYEKTEKYEEEVFVEKSIEETMKLFESEDYETLFEHIDERYKLCMGFNDVESLKTYIIDFYGKPNTISLLDFSRTNEALLCRVRLELAEEMVVKHLVVIPKENDDFDLMFDRVQQIKNYPASSSVVNDRLKYALKYQLTTDVGYTLVFEMTNRTSKTIQGSLAESYVFTTDTRSYFVQNADDLKNISLAPNETKVLLFKIDTSDGKFLEEEATRFVLKETNGQETTLSVARQGIYDLY
ncbi:MAG: hypothetical protein IKJ32_04480 [Clostridia bacterium]|nr:hypothetical protein [Clostridia bacterium]